MGRYVLSYAVVSEYDGERPDKDEILYFKNAQAMHDFVNRLAKEYGERLIIELAGCLVEEFKYEHIEVVTEYVPVEVG